MSPAPTPTSVVGGRARVFPLQSTPNTTPLRRQTSPPPDLSSPACCSPKQNKCREPAKPDHHVDDLTFIYCLQVLMVCYQLSQISQVRAVPAGKSADYRDGDRRDGSLFLTPSCTVPEASGKRCGVFLLGATALGSEAVGRLRVRVKWSHANGNPFAGRAHAFGLHGKRCFCGLLFLPSSTYSERERVK